MGSGPNQFAAAWSGRKTLVSLRWGAPPRTFTSAAVLVGDTARWSTVSSHDCRLASAATSFLGHTSGFVPVLGELTGAEEGARERVKRVQSVTLPLVSGRRDATLVGAYESKGKRKK